MPLFSSIKQILKPDRYVGLAFLFGLTSVLAFPPFGYSFLALLSLMGLFWLWLTKATTPLDGFKYGFWFGIGQFGLGVSWLFSSVYFYSEVGLAGAVLIVIGFVIVLALFPGFAGALARWLKPIDPNIPRAKVVFLCLILPASWVLFELIRSHSFGGLPFLLMGSAQLGDMLDGFLPVFGVFGVSFLLAVMAGLLLSLWLTRWYMLSVSGLVGLSLSAWILQQVDWVTPIEQPINLALMQGNIPQDQKWQASEFVPMVRSYTDMTQRHWDADLIVWPETAVPGYYDSASRIILRTLIREAKQQEKDVLIGVITRDADSDTYFNAMVNVRDDSAYHKRHLVMFGEYYPFSGLVKTFAEQFDFPFSQFTSGSKSQSLMTLAGQPVGVSICFETMFGAELAKDAKASSYLITTSNDAWFAHTFEPAQLRHEAQLRARELGREIARATNTGYSVIINTRGQITASIPPYQQGVLRGDIQPYQGMTPFVRWTNWPIWVLVLLLVGGFGWRRLRQK